jgi:urease accessory protein UreF
VTKFCVTDLPRRELSQVLRRCKDEQKLQSWLAEEVKAGCLCGALMVQARYSAVRRRRELRDLKAAVVVNQMTEVTGR